LLLNYSGWPEAPSSGCLDVTSCLVYNIFGNLFVVHERLVLPPFIPNEYMFEKFKDKGSERSHVYAWCVREAMSRASEIPTDDKLDMNKKFEYMNKVGLMTDKFLEKMLKKKRD